MGTYIKLKKLKKSFKKRVILDDINLEINKGEIFGIIGMSGSGKTTLLNTLIGFLEPEQGDIEFYSETEKKLLNIVKKNGVSKSKWIADLIKEKTSNTWPDHIATLAGAWKDLPTAEEIRIGLGKDAKREPL